MASWKELIPPVIARIYRHIKLSVLYSDAMWRRRLMGISSLAHDDVKQDILQFSRSDSIKFVSKYWRYLCLRNIQQIIDYGMENYLETVGRNYYSWTSIMGDFEDVSSNVNLADILERHKLLNSQESVIYNVVLFYLIDCARSRGLDVDGILAYAPLSHESVTSLLEYDLITRYVKPKRIIEIGSGSGRTALCFLRNCPHIEYCVVDIPPALSIARHSLAGYKVKFILPHQLHELVGGFDLCLAIDCLHELDYRQTEFYLEWIKRNTQFFYFKVWDKTQVPFSNVKYEYSDFITGEILYNGVCDYPSVMREVVCQHTQSR